MNPTEIRYTYSSFASTNPPRNYSRTLDLRKRTGAGIELEVSEYNNGLTVTKVFAVSQEQFDEIGKEFEKLNILDEVSRDFTESKPAPEMPQMVGGAENHAITFIAGKVSIACFYLPESAAPLVAGIGALAEKCGEPVFDTKTGADMNSPDYSPMAVAAQTVAKIEEIKKAAVSKPVLAEGEWLCSGCGNINGDSKFCTECGAKRPE